MKRRAQMEVMGLVLIVILIAIAMLFTLQFVILQKPPEIKKLYTHSKLASTTLNALLKTNTECKGIDFTGLLQDCAANKNNSYGIQCNGQDSCSYTKEKLNNIFNNTLRKWNIEFQFTADLADIEIGQPCLGEKQTKPYPIPTDVGIMIIKLDICS